MTLYRFVVRSLWYFRKQGVALFAGTLISTGVLTGALIIGDSVKYSLRKLVDIRLGKTGYALVAANRFFRADLAGEFASRIHAHATPLMVLQGIAVNPETKTRINKVQVAGIDNSFRYISDNFQDVKDDEAIISENIAGKLNLKIGDEFLLRVQNADLIPLNIPFTTDNAPDVPFRLTIKVIAGDADMGRFSLKSNQVAPYNVFISRAYLSKKLNLQGLANVILMDDDGTMKKDQLSAINEQLNAVWQPEDAGLKFRDLSESGKYEIISDREFIDEPLAKAIQSISTPHESILTYLVNTFRHKDNETPYSFITAASVPLLPATLRKDEMIVNDWLAKDLNVSKGDSVSIDYYVIGPLRTLNEKSRSFIVKEVIPTESTIQNSFLSSFPGLSDAVSCRNWNTSIPINLKRIRDKDEQYWKIFKGTPKAFISLPTGIELWRNQIGSLTAIRFDKKNITLNELRKQIKNKIKPEDFGLEFIPVRKDGLKAAGNSVDFGELFLGLSFFIIAAGILLTMLIYMLNTESRSQETAILSGLGLSRKLILKIRFAESAAIILLGGISGAFTGILYNYCLLSGLNSVWQNVIRTKIMEVLIKPETLLLGALSGIIVSCLSIFTVAYRKLKQPVAELVKNSFNNYSKFKVQKSKLRIKLIAFTCIGAAMILVSYSIITSAFESEILFLSAGGFFLIGSVAFILIYLRVEKRPSAVFRPSLIRLSLKNAGRNTGRSISVILLLAIGVFSIIITGVNEKSESGNRKSETSSYQSGTGGYLYWVETAIPVSFDLNKPSNRQISKQSDFRFLQFHNFEGDDASCLNLNLVNHPRILGINPEKFDARRAFTFVKVMKEVNKDHPWLELNRVYGIGRNQLQRIYSAYADQTVIKYNLKKSLGDTLTYLNEFGNKIRFRLMGGLENSIFQGNILVSDSLFMLNFPSAAGSKIMLVDTINCINIQVPGIRTKIVDKPYKQDPMHDALNSMLMDYGAEITPAFERLNEFNSVENTYLSVFMVLGGLGIIISTLGLGIVILRNMLERKHEMALLLAVGYTKQDVFKLVFTENLFLLFSGLLCGIVAAIIAILPSLSCQQSAINTRPLAILILLITIILTNGIIWIYFPAKYAMKGNLIKGLRND